MFLLGSRNCSTSSSLIAKTLFVSQLCSFVSRNARTRRDGDAVEVLSLEEISWLVNDVQFYYVVSITSELIDLIALTTEQPN